MLTHTSGEHSQCPVLERGNNNIPTRSNADAAHQTTSTSVLAARSVNTKEMIKKKRAHWPSFFISESTLGLISGITKFAWQSCGASTTTNSNRHGGFTASRTVCWAKTITACTGRIDIGVIFDR
jgi:hypothetical protein